MQRITAAVIVGWKCANLMVRGYAFVEATDGNSLPALAYEPGTYEGRAALDAFDGILAKLPSWAEICRQRDEAAKHT